VIPDTTLGILRVAAAKQFVLEAEDHRIITYKLTDQTKIDRGGTTVQMDSFGAGDHLTVDSTSNEDGYFTAVAVTFNQAGTDADRDAAARTWDLPDLGVPLPVASSKRADPDDDARPTLRRSNDKSAAAETVPTPSAPSPTQAAQTAPPEDDRPSTLVRPPDPSPDADDPGRPQLRRGRPAPRMTAANSEPPSVSPPESAAPAQPSSEPAREQNATTTQPQPVVLPDLIPVEQDPIIVKAREAAISYTESLPNFLAKQVITRYDTESAKQGWIAHDVVTSDLTYEKGKEEYTNIKVGSRSVKSMEESGGSWSTGQFAAILEDLFEDHTAATFRKSGQETIQNRRADVFTFDVKRESANWRIIAPSQLYYPAYRGKIWVDKSTSRVLRIEMESRGMPVRFPFAKVETAIDYDIVKLSGTQAFLLPTVAEVLMCEQGSPRCQRNRIEYRNYRKFGAESGISFEDKQ